MNLKTKFRTKFGKKSYPPVIVLGVAFIVLLLLSGCGEAPTTPVPTPMPSQSELWNAWANENRPDAPIVLELVKVPNQVGSFLNLELLVNSNAQEVWHEICFAAIGANLECQGRAAGASISHSFNLTDGSYVIEVRVTAINYPPSDAYFASLGGAESHGVWTHQFTVDSSPVTLSGKPIVVSTLDEVQIGGTAIDVGTGISLVNIAEAPKITAVPDANGFFALRIPRSEIGNKYTLTLQLFDNAMNATKFSVLIPAPANSWVGRSGDVNNSKVKYVFPAVNWHPQNPADAGIHFLLGWGNVYWQLYDASSQPVGPTVTEPTWWVVLRWTFLIVVAVVFLFVPDLLFKRSLFRIFKPSFEKMNDALSNMAEVVNHEAEARKKGLVSREEMQRSLSLLAAQNKSHREQEETMEAALELLAQYRPGEADVLFKLLSDPRGQKMIEAKILQKKKLSLERRHHGN